MDVVDVGLGAIADGLRAYFASRACISNYGTEPTIFEATWYRSTTAVLAAQMREMTFMSFGPCAKPWRILTRTQGWPRSRSRV
jgi:hypothetical protein